MRSPSTTTGLDLPARGAIERSRLLPDFSQSPVARYIQLATLFRNRITTGHWQVEHRIPNVDDLARDHGVARETIRQAIGILEREGLLQRARAKGTHVLRSPVATPAHVLEVRWSQLADAHEGAELSVLDRGSTTSPPIGIPCNARLASRYRTMRRLHARDGAPYLLSTLYLDEKLYRRVPVRRFATQSTLKILEEMPDLDIRRAEQVMTIGMADIEASRLLGVPVNSPVCLLHRIAVDAGGQLVYVGEGVYRGDALRLEMKFK